MALCVCLTLTLLPAVSIPARAADVISVNSEKALREALSGSSGSVEIKLTRNITITYSNAGSEYWAGAKSNGITISKDTILDLNGYTLSVTTSTTNSNAVKINSNRGLIVRDTSAGQNGLLRATHVDDANNHAAGGYGAGINVQKGERLDITGNIEPASRLIIESGRVVAMPSPTCTGLRLMALRLMPRAMAPLRAKLSLWVNPTRWPRSQPPFPLTR